jgi:hypothetical protein
MNKILIRFRELIRGKGKKNVTEIKYFSPTEQTNFSEIIKEKYYRLC